MAEFIEDDDDDQWEEQDQDEFQTELEIVVKDVLEYFEEKNGVKPDKKL